MLGPLSNFEGLGRRENSRPVSGHDRPYFGTLSKMKTLRLSRWMLVMGVLALPVQANATIVVPLSVEDMTTRSAIVVRGKVLASRPSWNADKSRIYTRTEVEVLEGYAQKGENAAKIFVRTLGGVVGDVGMNVSGAARFHQGEEVVLFLRKSPVAATDYQVVGMAQGKYRVRREDKGRVLAVPDTHGLAFAKQKSGRISVDPTHAPSGAMLLTDLATRIRNSRPTVKPNPTLPTPVPVELPQNAVPAQADTTP